MDDDDAWLYYSELDQNKFTLNLALFSLFSSLVTQPLNVITTRQQAGKGISTTEKSNIVNDITTTFKAIGFKGLFRGWAPLATVGLPSNVVYLTINEQSREYFQQKIKTLFPSLSHIYVDGIQSATSSLIANAISLIPYVPGEVVSSKLIVQSKDGLNVRQMIYKIYKDSGIGGFYKGFSISLFFACLFSTEWWWVYSVMRRECHHIKVIGDSPVLLDVVAGVSAGVITTVCMHPVDTIKTKIMTGSYLKYYKTDTPLDSANITTSTTATSTSTHGHNPNLTNISTSTSTSSVQSPTSTTTTTTTTSNTTSNTNIPRHSVRQVVMLVLKKEGYKALWRGLSASMYQSIISSAGFSIMYELIKRYSLSDDSSSQAVNKVSSNNNTDTSRKENK